MKRRKFTQSVLTTVGLSALPIGISLAKNTQVIQKLERLTSKEGLKLYLKSKLHPTKNQDIEQYILTYDVENNSNKKLVEKIYQLQSKGQKIDIFMTPIGGNQLQAVFNTQLYS